MTDLPGLDLSALTAWFPRHVDSADGSLDNDLSAELIAGGKSNLTYRITAGDRTWILRRPPVGKLLATAHDMSREFRMMSALADTDVPVPTMHAFCADVDVLGAPFYVMSDVDGVPYRRASELRELGPERVRAMSERLVDTLVAVHQVNPADVGLGDFGRPESFVGRQVERWRKQFEAAHTRDLPDMERLYARLRDRVPADSAPGIVHGDFRLDNVLIDAQERPAAVVDWELATIGDSMTDLALMLVYGHLATAIPDAVSDVTQAPGFLTERQIIDRYAEQRGGGLGDVGFYLGLAGFKLAGIVEGIRYRFVNNQTVGPDFEDAGDATNTLLRAGLKALEEN